MTILLYNLHQFVLVALTPHYLFAILCPYTLAVYRFSKLFEVLTTPFDIFKPPRSKHHTSKINVRALIWSRNEKGTAPFQQYDSVFEVLQILRHYMYAFSFRKFICILILIYISKKKILDQQNSSTMFLVQQRNVRPGTREKEVVVTG